MKLECRGGLKYYAFTFTEIETTVLLRHGLPPPTVYANMTFDTDVAGPQLDSSRRAQREWMDKTMETIVTMAAKGRRVSARRWAYWIAYDIKERNAREELEP